MLTKSRGDEKRSTALLHSKSKALLTLARKYLREPRATAWAIFRDRATELYGAEDDGPRDTYLSDAQAIFFKVAREGPNGRGLEETAAWEATRPPHYDDDPKPALPRATPPSEQEIRLAFAVMLDLADRVDEAEGRYRCDAPTVTGRAIQASLFAAMAYHQQARALSIPQTEAAQIVISLATNFIADKPPRPKRFDELSLLRRNYSTFLMLGGRSSYQIGERLRCDPSALRKKQKSELTAIDQKFGPFCKKYKGLLKKWRLPQNANPLCHNNQRTKGTSGTRPGKSPAAFGSVIDPDFDAEPLLSELIDALAALRR